VRRPVGPAKRAALARKSHAKAEAANSLRARKLLNRRAASVSASV
jgi:hypothetical protein